MKKDDKCIITENKATAKKKEEENERGKLNM